MCCCATLTSLNAFISFLFSCYSSPQTQEALRKTATTNRRHPVHHRNAARSLRKRQHKYGRVANDEERLGCTQGSPQRYVSVLKILLFRTLRFSPFAHRNIDDVHDMMDDIAEQNEIANEISNAVSQAVGFQDVDEDELERELEELEQEELDKEMLGVTTPADTLPDVPSTELPEKSKEKKKQPVKEDDMDADMKELMSWAE
jgi:hypothetical protein